MPATELLSRAFFLRNIGLLIYLIAQIIPCASPENTLTNSCKCKKTSWLLLSIVQNGNHFNYIIFDPIYQRGLRADHALSTIWENAAFGKSKRH